MSNKTIKTNKGEQQNKKVKARLQNTHTHNNDIENKFKQAQINKET